jgi:hypothetical protein
MTPRRRVTGKSGKEKVNFLACVLVILTLSAVIPGRHVHVAPVLEVYEMPEPIPEASSRSTACAANATGVTDIKVTLSTLWIFAVLNYIYADLFTVMDPSTDTGSVHISHGMMLGAAVLMETAITMVPLSRLLMFRANRWANIVAGVVHTVAVILSLFVGGKAPASYYIFFASIEIVSTSLIVWYAWKWPKVEIG